MFYLNTQLMQHYWAASAPDAPVTVLDVDSPVAANDPYAALKNGFVTAKDGGALAMLQAYHAGLVPPSCFSAAKSFFDAH